MSSDRKCEKCGGSGYTPESLLLLVGVLLGLALVLAVLGKIWKGLTIKHILRCAFQPIRILITYSQITSQLGDVLDFTYPGLFGDVIKALKQLMDIYGLLFKALGPSECYGLRGFTSRWMLRIIGMPVVFIILILLYWIFDKQTNPDKAQPKVNMIRTCSLRCSFATQRYASSALHRSFGGHWSEPGFSILDADDQIECQEAGHRALQTVSGVIIAFIACGLPVIFAIVLIRAASQYQRDHTAPNNLLAQRVAKDTDVEIETAAWVIRDVTIGRDYSFLMDAYDPGFQHWEALDMLRKLALIGLVLCVGRGSVAQLSVAIVLSFLFFALQMHSWPYKVQSDNLFRAATEFHVFIVIMTALVMKHDLSWEIIGVDAYDYTLFFSFIVLVPGAFVVAVWSKDRRRAGGSAASLRLAGARVR